jgi:hypothetical protein
MTAPRPRSPGHGASLNPRVMHRPWRARIYIAGRHVHLGYFGSREEAKAAHAEAVRAHLGEMYLKSEDRPDWIGNAPQETSPA